MNRRWPCLWVGLAVLASGCVNVSPTAPGPRDHLAQYEGCNVLLPDGEPDPCRDDAVRVEATAGDPPTGWVCIWRHQGQGLFWNPVLDEHAFWIDIDQRADPTFTWLNVWSSEGERTWLAEREDHTYWWSIGHWPGDDLRYSWLSSRPSVATDDPTLQNASLRYLWTARDHYPWLNLRFEIENESYTFSANSESPLVPGQWNAASFHLEEEEFFLSFRLPLMEAGSVGAMGNPRVPRCT